MGSWRWLALGHAVLGWLPAAVGLHIVGIGAIGGMTLAVMMRASLGHTGRDVQAGPALALAFGCVALAALVRVAVPSLSSPARRQPNPSPA